MKKTIEIVLGNSHYSGGSMRIDDWDNFFTHIYEAGKDKQRLTN